MGFNSAFKGLINVNGVKFTVAMHNPQFAINK